MLTLTSEKQPKKSYLRNAEYYDFQSVLDELYAKSEKGRVFNSLMGYITSPQNIMLAYRNIKKNSGSNAPGTDNRTIKDLERLSDEQLVALVQRKFNWYVPQSVRRVEIPKYNDPMKKRPLGIPTIMDRLIQQCVLQVLEPICEASARNTVRFADTTPILWGFTNTTSWLQKFVTISHHLPFQSTRA